MRKRYICMLLTLLLVPACNHKNNGNELEVSNKDGMFTYFADGEESSNGEDASEELDISSESISDENYSEDSIDDEIDMEDTDGDYEEDVIEDDKEDIIEDYENDSVGYDTWIDEEEQTTMVSEIEYNMYHNLEFAYAFVYPTSFYMTSEADNGEGAIFEDDNMATLNITGSYNNEETDSATILARYTDTFDDVEYSFAGDNYWCYTRMTDDGTIQYCAGYVDTEYEVSFTLEYEEDRQEEYGDVINALMEHLLNGNVF